MQRPSDHSAAGVRGHNHSPPVANDKWVASLRRRDPEIQPALPAIGTLRGRWVPPPAVIKGSPFHPRSASLNSNLPRPSPRRSSSHPSVARKSRSVERFPRPARPRPAPAGPAASAAPHLHHQHHRRSKKSSSTGSSEKEDQDGTGDEDREERSFNPIGYEAHLVDTLEKDILQRNPDVTWARIAGLDDAKGVLQEAVVLPILMPDFFKVSVCLTATPLGSHRPWSHRIPPTGYPPALEGCAYGWSTRYGQDDVGQSCGY